MNLLSGFGRLSLGVTARGLFRVPSGQACEADSHRVGRASRAHDKAVSFFN
jgi:hypothetical protein